jgi:hypothetical protein
MPKPMLSVGAPAFPFFAPFPNFPTMKYAPMAPMPTPGPMPAPVTLPAAAASLWQPQIWWSYAMSFGTWWWFLVMMSNWTWWLYFWTTYKGKLPSVPAPGVLTPLAGAAAPLVGAAAQLLTPVVGAVAQVAGAVPKAMVGTAARLAGAPHKGAPPKEFQVLLSTGQGKAKAQKYASLEQEFRAFEQDEAKMNRLDGDLDVLIKKRHVLPSRRTRRS